MYQFRKCKIATGYISTKIRRFVKKLNIFFKKWVFCKKNSIDIEKIGFVWYNYNVYIIEQFELQIKRNRYGNNI